MKRRLSKLPKLLTLLLAAAAVLAGVGSYVREVGLTAASAGARWSVSLSRGEVLVERATPLPGGSFPPGRRLAARPTRDFTDVISDAVYGSDGGTHVSYLGGVQFARAQLPKGGGLIDAEWVAIPLWLLLIPAAVAWAPAGWRAARGRTRRRPGHCRVCGYDLRATPERCPECGTVGGRQGESAG